MNCFTSSFIIDAVKAEDGGDIMFVVMNAKGADQAIVSVNVTYASSFAGGSHGKSSAAHPPFQVLFTNFLSSNRRNDLRCHWPRHRRAQPAAVHSVGDHGAGSQMSRTKFISPCCCFLSQPSQPL